MAEYSNVGETKWNFDDERMKILHLHMIELEYAFENWNLKLIYSKIKIIELIISGPMSDDEWNDIQKLYVELEKIHRKINTENDKSMTKNKIDFYNKARTLYIELNRIMNKRGFFFRIRENIQGL